MQCTCCILIIDFQWTKCQTRSWSQGGTISSRLVYNSSHSTYDHSVPPLWALWFIIQSYGCFQRVIEIPILIYSHDLGSPLVTSYKQLWVMLSQGPPSAACFHIKIQCWRYRKSRQDAVCAKKYWAHWPFGPVESTDLLAQTRFYWPK